MIVDVKSRSPKSTTGPARGSLWINCRLVMRRIGVDDLVINHRRGELNRTISRGSGKNSRAVLYDLAYGIAPSVKRPHESPSFRRKPVPDLVRYRYTVFLGRRHLDSGFRRNDECLFNAVEHQAHQCRRVGPCPTNPSRRFPKHAPYPVIPAKAGIQGFIVPSDHMVFILV